MPDEQQQQPLQQPRFDEQPQEPAPGEWASEEEDLEPLLPRREVSDSAEMDITPMIDITFLLLIFFLVCSTASMSSSVKLPPARRGTGVNDRTAVILTVVKREGPGPAMVFLGDGRQGAPLPDDEDAREEAIAQAVEEGFLEGKSSVLVKAEGSVRHGEVWRVEMAAARVEGIKMHVAVKEIQ